MRQALRDAARWMGPAFLVSVRAAVHLQVVVQRRQLGLWLIPVCSFQLLTGRLPGPGKCLEVQVQEHTQSLQHA